MNDLGFTPFEVLKAFLLCYAAGMSLGVLTSLFIVLNKPKRR